MTTKLIQEFVCATMGEDCSATEAWYEIDSADHLPTIRASAFWKHCREELQEAIASVLGISEPYPDNVRWDVLPAAIRADFSEAMKRAMDRISN